MTRPDITNAIRELGRHMQKPCMRHWRSIQHILKYLATYPDLGIFFGREEQGRGLQLKGYSDADLAGDPETRRSCTGYIILLGSSLVAWSSRTEEHLIEHCRIRMDGPSKRHKTRRIFEGYAK